MFNKDIFINKYKTKDDQEIKVYLTKTEPDFFAVEDFKDFTYDSLYNDINFNNFHAYAFIAKIENEIAGMVCMQVDRILPSNNTFFFRDVTKKEYRNCGVYNALFDARYNYAKNIVHSKVCTISASDEIVKKVLNKYNFIENGFTISYDMNVGLKKIPEFYCAF